MNESKLRRKVRCHNGAVEIIGMAADDCGGRRISFFSLQLAIAFDADFSTYS